MALDSVIIASAKFSPILLLNLLIASSLVSVNFFKSPSCVFSSSKKPDAISVCIVKKASFKFDTVPDKVCASLLVSSPNLPPVPNAFDNPLIESSTLTATPAEKPAIAVTALSLNKSAEPIPALNAL